MHNELHDDSSSSQLRVRRLRASAATLALTTIGLLLLASTAVAQGPRWNLGEECDQRFPLGYTHNIVGAFEKDEINLEISRQFAGAVSSLTLRGQEYINIFDHGRQISYAWHMNDLGECLNPTEPGSARDLFSPDSTSELHAVCGAGGNSVTTQTQPAYWLAPGDEGYCSGGVTQAQNTTFVSDHELSKTITIGYENLPNVIVFDAEITTPEDYNVLQAEIPTAYLTHEFSQRYTYNPVSHVLTSPPSQGQSAPWDYEHYGDLPVILATPDGQHALGAYTAESIINYGMFHSPSKNPANETNKWHMVAREEPAPAGTYHYRSFAIIGTLDEVQKTMSYLYEAAPSDIAPPQGTLDLASCDHLAGWAWDPKAPNRPIDVEVFEVLADGSTRLVTRITAQDYRPDLEIALGDNGRHGFVIPAEDVLPNRLPRTLRFEAVNSIAGLSNQLIDYGEVEMRCGF